MIGRSRREAIFRSGEKINLVKITANIREPIELQATLDANRVTAIIGPNAVGKTLLLRCVYGSTSGTKYNLSVDFSNVSECGVDEEFDHVIYLDPYAITYYIYDKYKEFFSEEEKGEISVLSRIGREVSGILSLNEVRLRSRDDDLFKAMKLVEDEIGEVAREAREAGHEEEVKYLMPLRVSVTAEGIEWKDVFGNEGKSVLQLPPSFYPALALTTMVYSYALSLKREKVLLLLDEPEAFAYPSTAYVLGRVAQRLASSSESLYIIAATHSWDFFKAVLRSKKLTTIYVMTREGNKATIASFEESWYVPGFSLVSVIS